MNHNTFKNPIKDDDSYINMENLSLFLLKIDPSKPFMIGSAGYGRNSGDYVQNGMNYCMGGTGVIFSRKLIHDITPYLRTICY